MLTKPNDPDLNVYRVMLSRIVNSRSIADRRRWLGKLMAARIANGGYDAWRQSVLVAAEA